MNGLAVPTPSQTVGPFFSMGLGPLVRNRVSSEEDEAPVIHVTGRILDGDRRPIGDAVVELWQADATGHYWTTATEGIDRRRGHLGFGRTFTDHDSGEFWFETIKPGTVIDDEGEPQAPHLALIVQARGLLRPCFTRMYFSDESERNSRDQVLMRVPESRRSTLVGMLVDGSEPHTYRFDVRFQGDDETVFLAY